MWPFWREATHHSDAQLIMYGTKKNLQCSSSSQDCISLGSGEPNASEYRSFVLYHNNSPRWSEMVKLPIPIDRFRGSHLRFEFRHCSSECRHHAPTYAGGVCAAAMHMMTCGYCTLPFS